MELLTFTAVEDYLQQEAKAEEKHEYHAGEIRAMAGASLAHNQMVSNLIFLINRCVWGGNCRVLPSDILVKLPECERYVYPDVVVVCGEVSIESRNGIEVLLNPTVVIKVLSDSTSAYDQNEKMKCYLALKSLKQYLMVRTDTTEVQSYTKQGENEEWLFRIFKKPSDQVRIQDCELLLEEVYQNV